MLKRILVIALLALISISSVFAVNLAKPSADNTYAAMVEPFQPLTARALGMGSAGVAVTGRSDTFYINPASLASKRFQLSLPSAQVTLYHVYDILESGMIENIMNGEDPYKGVGTILESIEAGKGKIADVDAGVSFTASGFGLGVNARASILTYGDDVGGLNSDIIAKVNAAVSMGYGFRINLPSDFSLDLGLMVRFNYLAYTEKVGAEKVQEVMGNEDPDIMSIFAGIPVMAGFSIPIDVGLNLNMPYGFSLGVVARNLNGKYHMTGFEGYEKFLQDPFGGKAENTGNKFTFNSDWSLDAGIGWSFNRWYFSPTIAVDVRDIVGLAQTKNVDFRDFMYHLNIGAEIRLLSFLDVRGGLSQGYWTLGVGIDLWAIKMDIAYFSQEFGDRVGDNGLDGLAIRFNIGFDR